MDRSVTGPQRSGQLHLDTFDLSGLDAHQIEALTVLLDDVRRSAALTVMGSYLLRQEIELALANLSSSQRLPIGDAGTVRCVIGGRPRSGTTLLHNLMALHPGFRALSGSEALAPFDPRIGLLRARERRRIAAKMSPGLLELHPPAIETAEESNVLTASTFRSWQFATALFVPNYAEWLRTNGALRSLEWESRVLAHLAPSAAWVLKSPFYCLEYAAVHRQWPEAVVVELQRDNSPTKRSWLKLVRAARSIYSNRPIVQEAEWTYLLSDHAAELRTNDIRLSYDELVRDPVRSCAVVLDSLGMDVTGDFVDAVRQFLRDDPLRRMSS